MADRSLNCWTCGRPRGLSLQRGSWGIDLRPPFVPRTENPEDRPSQIANDLICHAGIYRNGGVGNDTHLCDDCLRIGLRAIKVQIDALLGELDAGYDKEKALADLTDRLGRLQLQHHNACWAANRAQDALREVLALPELKVAAQSDLLRSARHVADRRPLDAAKP